MVPVCDRLEVRSPDGIGPRAEEGSTGIPLIEVSAWIGHGLSAGGREITNTTTRVYAHATGEWRQAALDELAGLPPATGPGRPQRAT